jgi:hypothetical protein
MAREGGSRLLRSSFSKPQPHSSSRAAELLVGGSRAKQGPARESGGLCGPIASRSSVGRASLRRHTDFEAADLIADRAGHDYAYDTRWHPAFGRLAALGRHCRSPSRASACKRGVRAPRLLRRARQHRCGRSVPSPGNLALVPVAPTPQPAHAPELGAHDPHRQPIAAVRPPNASLAPRALRRP